MQVDALAIWKEKNEIEIWETRHRLQMGLKMLSSIFHSPILNARFVHVKLQKIGKWISINICYCQVVKQLDSEMACGNLICFRYLLNFRTIILSILQRKKKLCPTLFSGLTISYLKWISVLVFSCFACNLEAFRYEHANHLLEMRRLDQIKRSTCIFYNSNLKWKAFFLVNTVGADVINIDVSYFRGNSVLNSMFSNRVFFIYDILGWDLSILTLKESRRLKIW